MTLKSAVTIGAIANGAAVGAWACKAGQTGRAAAAQAAKGAAIGAAAALLAGMVSRRGSGAGAPSVG